MRTSDHAHGAIYKKALADLLALRWEESDLPVDSGYALLMEGIRRTCLWQKQLGARKLSLPGNVVDLLDPSVEVDDSDFELVVGRIPLSGMRKAFAQDFACCFLLWALAQERGLTAGHDLPPPYDPWFRMYERGHIVGSHHGDLTIRSEGLLPVRDLHSFLKRPPLLDLSDEVLNEIDREGQRRFTRGG
jgi:hypothetical protein